MIEQNKKAKVWRTRNARGQISPELTTWSYLVPLPWCTVIGKADTHRDAWEQALGWLRRRAAA